MSIRRAVPDVQSDDATKTFSGDLLGFDVSMEEGRHLSFSSPSDPAVQLSHIG